MAVISTSTATASRHVRTPSPDTVGVEAGGDIPAGRFINAGTVDLVLGHDLLDDKRLRRVPTSSTDRRLKLYWRNERLESSGGDSLPLTWLHLVRCARDRHEQNLELVRSEEGLLVCTIREILQGEEMLIWYREGLAREVGVPILTPCHIRGHQKYVCTGCQAVYTHPNTLKAHMFLQCRKAVVSSTTDEEHLVPFHLLLQTLSQSSSMSAEKDRKVLQTCRNQRLAMAASSGLLPGCSGCGIPDSKHTYKSAFRSPSSARDIKKEVGADEGLMTPDSSTDQSSALNLSVKLTEACSSMDKVKDISLHAVHQWDTLTAQRMMAQTLPVPVEYTNLTGCYPVSPHLHAFGIQFMTSSQSALPPGHRYDTSFGGSLCSSGDYSLISPHLEDVHENIGFSLFKPQPSPGSSSVRQVRGNNPYSFTLPSDKEPLDLLPQAYFANKSKKGHLCLCCGKLYSRKYGLKIHMRTHNGYKPLKCKICSRPFGDPSNLNKHVRLHAQGETPYRCDFCGKVLVRRRDLERHVRSRHPMGCVPGESTLGVCESSPDSSPVSVESSENSMASKDPMYENS